jgi:hypothetical protein
MNKRYLNIPIPMLKELHTDSDKFFNDVFDVGIYLYAKTLEGDEEKQYQDALKFLGITQGNIWSGIRNAKSILAKLPQKYPIAGIEKDILFDFYKNLKSEFDMICFAAFLAIRSILGKKVFCKTNKQLIHARMFGYVSAKELPTKLSPQEAKYKLRWHIDKILFDLQTNWHLKLYAGHQRGMYVSFDLELPKLIEIAEKSKYKNKVSEFKKMKQEIINQTVH